MSEIGESIIKTILGEGTDAWGRLVFAPITYTKSTEQELRSDLAAVEQSVANEYPKITNALYAAAFAKMASSETGYRAFAATILHKRHQLNRRTKVLAAINQASGLFADSGPIVKTSEGLPHA